MSNEDSLPAFTLFGLDDVENYGLVSPPITGIAFSIKSVCDFSNACSIFRLLIEIFVRVIVSILLLD